MEAQSGFIMDITTIIKGSLKSSR